MYRLRRLKNCEYLKDEFVQTCTESFLLECRVRNLAPKTIEVYAERIKYLYEYLLARNLKLSEVCRYTLQEYILSIVDRVSPETVNGQLRVYRRFFNYLEEEELLVKNPMKRIKLLRTEKKIKKVLSLENISALLRSIDKKSLIGARNFNMILVFWDCMLRRGELLGLRKSDVNLEEGYITVNGKGRKQRLVPLGPRTAKSLHLFIKQHLKDIRGEWIFGTREGTQMSEG